LKRLILHFTWASDPNPNDFACLANIIQPQAPFLETLELSFDFVDRLVDIQDIFGNVQFYLKSLALKNVDSTEEYIFRFLKTQAHTLRALILSATGLTPEDTTVNSVVNYDHFSWIRQLD
jgi:hypothetical protein